jgi:alpha-1,3-rhamnosyl/mannosyltransferase
MINVGFGVTILNRAKALGGIDGIGTYTRELMDGLSRSPDQLRLHPFLVRTTENIPIQEDLDSFDFGNFRAQVIASSVFGTPFLGAKQFASEVEIVHATDHFIPRLKKTPLVATLMDAIPISHPEWASAEYRAIKNYFWTKTAQWADQVITISAFSKSQVAEHFRIPSDRIVSIPLGVDQRWFREVPKEGIKDALDRYQLPSSFFLSIGTLQPRKNIERLVSAYQSLPGKVRAEVPLVIVGRSGWGCDKLVSDLQSQAFGKSVIWLQHLPGDDLIALMKGATAFVFPSLFEGFGLPVLEAFAAGIPVIASNTTSLPEVAGDCAILVDPLDTSSIAQGMLRLLEDSHLSASLVDKGRARATQFSWDRTAASTLKVYRDVLSHY